MLFLVAMVLLFVLGMPIAFAIGLATVAQMLISDAPLPLEWVPKRMAEGLASFPLIAVPFFILAANLMNTGGITMRLFDLAKALVGHLRGGLAQVNVVASLLFSGMSGSAVADAAGLGRIEIKAMKDDGYDPGTSAAITAASATIGPLVPPSIPLVIYATLAEQSVVSLLLAGLVPGLLLALAFMGVIAALGAAQKDRYPKHSRPPFRELANVLRRSLLPLITPVILIGGILSGMFTPTEAALVASGYALVLATLVYRELNAGQVFDVFAKTAIETGKVMFIVGVAYPASLVLTMHNLPQSFVQLFVDLGDSRFTFLLAINVMLLIVGCFMETISAMIVIVPMILAAGTMFGVDPVHLGIIVTFNLMIGLITPPFGLNMFIAAEIAGVSIRTFVRSAMPYYFALIAMLALITYFPELSLFLPKLL